MDLTVYSREIAHGSLEKGCEKTAYHSQGILSHHVFETNACDNTGARPLSCVSCSRLLFPYLVCFLSSSDVIIS